MKLVVPEGDKLCVGSGQKPYDQAQGWINIDINDRWSPDVVADWNDLSMFADNSMNWVVAEQTVEHVGCGDAQGFFKEAYRVLKPGGSLVFTVPDMKALAQRWLLRLIDDYIFSVNMYGAYMDSEADRHKWNTSSEGWVVALNKAADWGNVQVGIGVLPEGSQLARDWWILEMGAVK
tara:strand:- start:1058 stop:1588 length:531 start_codon:yes stop_codon:yes gene_type:complete